MVHCYVKDFISHMSDNKKLKQKGINALHSELYQSLSHVKGIGPLSFNQFWHALCLCGVFPATYIQSSNIAPNSGPAKLIQTFYPSCSSTQLCLKKMQDVKRTITSFGLRKVTDFFLENMYCELWRLANKTNIVLKTTENEEARRDVFLSDCFHDCLLKSTPTKNPDIYYKNPFTDSYQHLFRIDKDHKDLIMRPCFLNNSNLSSSTLRCKISYSTDNDIVKVSWDGDYVRKCSDSPSNWFIKQ